MATGEFGEFVELISGDSREKERGVALGSALRRRGGFLRL